MTKEELLEMVEETYWPTWEAVQNIEQFKSDVNELYALPPNSKEYLELKTKVIGYLSMDCIEQFEGGGVYKGHDNKEGT